MDTGALSILQELRKGKYAPVYVLQGEETYYIDLIANHIEANALSDSEKSFNQVILYGKDSPVNLILSHARRFPMMAERQVVIVREAQEIPDWQKEPGLKQFLDYAARPVPSTVLVICHMHKNIDKRRELGKRLDQLKLMTIFKKPHESALPEFIAAYFNEKGYKANDESVRILAEYVGNDLQRVANEIDKLLIGVPKGEVVEALRVMNQVGISREYNIFELQKAMVVKDTLLAAKIVNYFEHNTKKNPAIPIVAFLYYFFSKMLAASVVPGRHEREIVSALKISPFAAKDYINALPRYTPRRLMENIHLLKEADLRLKGVNSGEESEGQILKELVFRLMI